MHGKYTSRLPSGVLSLKVCIDSEIDDTENEHGEDITLASKEDDPKWPLKSCMRELLEDNCDPNAEDITGEKLIYYVIRKNKKRSMKMLLEYGLDLKVTALDRITSPFGEAMK